MALLAHYKFEDDLTDETGNHDGISAGSISYDSDGIDGKALKMESGNNGFKSPSSLEEALADASEWTIDMYAKATDLSDEWNCLLRDGPYAYWFGESSPSWAPDKEYSIHVNFINSGADSCTPKNSISANTWYRCTFIREGGINKVYIDGVLKLSADDGNVGFYDDEITWGYDTYGNQDFAGFFDEIKVYDSVETPLPPDVEINTSDTVSKSESVGLINPSPIERSKKLDNWVNEVKIYTPS